MTLTVPASAPAPSQASAAVVTTDIPARLDRLRWGRFHTLVVVALGITWILDGLEVTLAGAISPALKESPQLRFSNADVGLASSAYLAGAVLGALFFGWLTDRLGRKRLFFITLAVYLVATASTALSWNLASFALFRFFTGAGIGGEYTAINSTIQELVPARYRGWTDLVINGSFWIGTALGAAGSLVVLDPSLLPPDLGWRAAFLIGAVLGLVIFLMRLWLPESPRWLMTHGRVEEATAVLDRIEAEFRARSHHIPDEPLPVIRLRARRSTPLAEVADTLFRVERRRTLVGLSLMVAQAFFYNAIFFTYALVLTKFYNVSNNAVPLYGLAFAVGNLAGPLLLGHLFDTVGRKKMISGTYLISGGMLAFSAWLFAAGILSAAGQTFIWIIIFFFASAGASAGYLTVSEIFPIEIRAEALAVFFAIAQVFGAIGPAFYGVLIGNGSNRASLAIGYLVGGGIMIIGGVVEAMFGINAEGKSLETIAPPLTEVGSGKQGEDEHDRYRRSGQL